MPTWTAEDFKFIRGRMEELQAEEAAIVAGTKRGIVADEFGSISRC